MKKITIIIIVIGYSGQTSPLPFPHPSYRVIIIHKHSRHTRLPPATARCPGKAVCGSIRRYRSRRLPTHQRKSPQNRFKAK
ncbi:hypothetical protein T492DRAFT_519291 [Pavlovales sp. CCMP2436]|nr:hypothetical protein T492DRAFT_519291 [Pavlovales sp. CCMP2436]